MIAFVLTSLSVIADSPKKAVIVSQLYGQFQLAYAVKLLEGQHAQPQ